MNLKLPGSRNHVLPVIVNQQGRDIEVMPLLIYISCSALPEHKRLLFISYAASTR